MIIVKLKGGLGNQLFQYAFGKKIALKNNTELKLDIFQYEGESSYRDYALKHFGIQASIAKEDDIYRFKPQKLYKRILYGIINKPIKSKRYIKLKYYNEYQNTGYDDANRIFCPAFSSIPNNSYIDGFWQTEKYFKEIRHILLDDLTITTSPTDENKKNCDIIMNSNAISLHVRRGDYTFPQHINNIGQICSINYYQEAIKYIANNVESPVFYIFSDDIKWCQSNLPKKHRLVFVDTNQERSCYEDFRLMRLCKHNIIANSTFSWWSAWLNKNEAKIVISPDKWDTNNTFKDTICLDWIKIKS